MNEHTSLCALNATGHRGPCTCRPTSPRPWFVVGPPWNSGRPYVIAGDDDPHVGTFVCDIETPDTRDAGRDELADAELIVRAVNEYEALLACEHYLRVLLAQRDTVMLFLASVALAELDKVRNG